MIRPLGEGRNTSTSPAVLSRVASQSGESSGQLVLGAAILNEVVGVLGLHRSFLRLELRVRGSTRSGAGGRLACLCDAGMVLPWYGAMTTVASASFPDWSVGAGAPGPGLRQVD